ncbi:MAG: chemotaxis protein CheW, partial [Candidatus Margulisiibacteriota bacterium]
HDKATFVVSDDGKGIDPDIIRKSLIKKDLVTPAIAKSLSDTEVINYIFHPGFSTKEAVSDISGRGVGMDVVQNKVQKLGGQITVESTLGQGTHFRISLPLTMAIIHGLVTLCQKRTFIIPISFVDEGMRCSGKDVRFINQKPHILLRENLIPLVNLGQLLYGKEFDIRIQKKLFIVVVNYNDALTGILVDKLLGEEEIVIKNIDSASSKYYIIQSATIMGTGDIGLILDVTSLMNLVISQRESTQPQEAESAYEYTHS